IFCMDRAGLSANDGPTHHGLFDIAYLRCLPNIILMAPADEDELQDMMFTATLQSHPVAIRYPRGPAEGVPTKDQPAVMEIGKAMVLGPCRNNGERRAAFLSLGNMQKVAREAIQILEADGWDCALINPRFCKPLDAAVHEFFGRAADVVATLEDHALMGGYGSAVLECYQERRVVTPVVRLGWPDQFIEHASSVEHLREKYGVTASRLVDDILRRTKAAP